MEIDALIADLHPQLTALRRDLHAHPELGFAETRTAEIVARRLEAMGMEVHTGLARTGVVGRLKLGNSGRSIGLRADMDALPMSECNTFDHRSRHEGRMHACGHDGHVALLLGAAEILAKVGNFDGTVHFVFQPAEETDGGGRLMVEEGLFERFPMDMVFALHNWPGLPVGQFGLREGAVMAGADRFEISIQGRGAHAAMPHQGRDVMVAGAALIQGFQTLVSRDTSPTDAAVVSVTRFNAGNSNNVLPDKAILGGTVRMFKPELREALRTGMARICNGIEEAYAVEISLDYQTGYPPTVNSLVPLQMARIAARSLVGDANVHEQLDPSMGTEDFAYLANAVPGCYGWIGNGSTEGGCVVHNPHYDFNDKTIPLGVGYWVKLTQHVLAPGERQ
ncbi:MAG: M20 aminoacylase family protein [Sterolibacterium sp.]|jgi:hippurate hydrolase